MVKRKQIFFVVLPAYNEQKEIGMTIKSCLKETPNVVVVDDGSTDMTRQKAEKENALVLGHRVNLGKGAAMKTGAEAAFRLGADGVVFLDADGQHDPRKIPQFIKKIDEGYQIIFGERNLQGVPLMRLAGNKLVSFLIYCFLGIRRKDPLCGYFALTEEAFRKIKWQSSDYSVETEIVVKTARAGLKYAVVPIKTIYRDRYKGVTILDGLKIFLTFFGFLLK